MPSKDVGRDPADALRKFADMLDEGCPADEIGPFLFLMARGMMRQAKKAKPRK